MYTSRCFPSITSPPQPLSLMLAMSSGDGGAEDKLTCGRCSKRNFQEEGTLEYFDYTGVQNALFFLYAPPWQGRRQAGSVGRAGRPQAWAPAGAGGQGVGGRGRGGRREKWLYFSYIRETSYRLLRIVSIIVNEFFATIGKNL